MCENCAKNEAALAEVNQKLDYIISTVENTIGMLAANPMLKAMLPKGF